MRGGKSDRVRRHEDTCLKHFSHNLICLGASFDGALNEQHTVSLAVYVPCEFITDTQNYYSAYVPQQVRGERNNARR